MSFSTGLPAQTRQGSRFHISGTETGNGSCLPVYIIKSMPERSSGHIAADVADHRPGISGGKIVVAICGYGCSPGNHGAVSALIHSCPGSGAGCRLGSNPLIVMLPACGLGRCKDGDDHNDRQGQDNQFLYHLVSFPPLIIFLRVSVRGGFADWGYRWTGLPTGQITRAEAAPPYVSYIYKDK